MIFCNVFFLRNVQSARNIRNFIDNKKPKHAVIAGTGFIGFEMLENLMGDGVNVTIVEMQNKMREVNKYNIENSYPKIEMGIGIHTGDVILGNIGSEKKTKYDIIGKNVNLASRIETFTVGGQILISEQTKACSTNVKINGTKEIFPKGVSEPIIIYNVAGIGEIDLYTEEQFFVKLKKPMMIELNILDGKFASNDLIIANVLELSEKQAILDREFSKNTNIKFLNNGKEIFAKFIESNKIHITMGEIKC